MMKEARLIESSLADGTEASSTFSDCGINQDAVPPPVVLKKTKIAGYKKQPLHLKVLLGHDERSETDFLPLVE